LGVTQGELRDAVRRIKSRKAPGPDGVHGKVWALASKEIGEYMRHLLSRCLKEGRFPPDWKRAKLVLIPKGGKPEDVPSSYRPICLLDEAGKIMERIIADRLVRQLSRVGPDLSKDQCGFRGGRSTIDAILRVRSAAEAEIEDGGVLLAVSLDIANAFNTLPWRWIVGALHHHVPRYLIAMIGDYFRGRVLEYRDRDGTVKERSVGCGIPQGSVLGPLLWNLAYDRVLRSALPPGSTVVCYADDTSCPGHRAGGKRPPGQT